MLSNPYIFNSKIFPDFEIGIPNKLIKIKYNDGKCYKCNKINLIPYKDDKSIFYCLNCKDYVLLYEYISEYKIKEKIKEKIDIQTKVMKIDDFLEKQFSETI